MAADDKQNGNAKGFSGLSTLVSDVDEGSPACQPTPQVTPPPSSAPVPESPPIQAKEASSASNVPQPSKSMSDGSSDVATGKRMVGIGLGIGLLLIFFVNSTKNEPTRSATVLPILGTCGSFLTSFQQVLHPPWWFDWGITEISCQLGAM